MAFGLSGYNISPLNYTGKDGILFHLKDDMSVFLKLSSTTDMAFSAPMQASTQPVQTGQTITDNIQESPQTIAINGVVVVGYEGAFFTEQNTTVVEDFVATLQRWRQQRQILRVLCKDGISLENAVCTNFEAKKDKNIENGLNISLTFQDINFVAQIGQTQAPNDSKNANGSKGAKTKTGAVESKKDVGKAGTQTTVSRTKCQIVEDRINALDTTAWLKDAQVGCYKGASATKGVIKYNETEGGKYIPKGVYGAQGGNINKIPKAG